MRLFLLNSSTLLSAAMLAEILSKHDERTVIVIDPEAGWKLPDRPERIEVDPHVLLIDSINVAEVERLRHLVPPTPPVLTLTDFAGVFDKPTRKRGFPAADERQTKRNQRELQRKHARRFR